jgi:hypothetical protein
MEEHWDGQLSWTGPDRRSDVFGSLRASGVQLTKRLKVLEIVKREASTTSKGTCIIQPAETYHTVPGDSVLGTVVGKYILVHLVYVPTNVGS